MPTTRLERLAPAIINLLSTGSLSLEDIRVATKTSTPTLRRTLRALVKDAWIRPVGRSLSTGGRPAILYGLDNTSYLLIGVHIELPGLHLVVISLDATVVDHQYIHASAQPLPNDVISEIVHYVSDVRLHYKDRPILGLGIATPGYVDPVSGEILLIGRAPLWQSFPLQARLEADLGMPVVVENDVDCMTQVELAASRLAPVEDMIYLGLLEGIKASLVLGGQVYRGPFGNAGLIGHTTVAPNGPLCSCGKRGCLEAIASVQAICESFDRRVSELADAAPSLRSIKAIVDRSQKFAAVLDAAEAGEPLCVSIVEDMIEALALATSNLICLLQVSVLILGGALCYMPAGLRAQLERQVRQRLPSLLSHHLVIRSASVTDPHSAAVGAARQLLQRYLAEAEFPRVEAAASVSANP